MIILRLTFAVVPALFYTQSGDPNDTATITAKGTYQSMSKDICRLITAILFCKQAVSDDRTKFAHPTISREFLEEFLESLGANNPHLSHLELRLFDHLRTTLITASNIEGAKRGLGWK